MNGDSELIKKLAEEVRLLREEMTPDVFVSCKEAARYLGVAQQTISNYLKQGRLTKRTAGEVTGIPLRQLTVMKRKNRREAGELPDS